MKNVVYCLSSINGARALKLMLSTRDYSPFVPHTTVVLYDLTEKIFSGFSSIFSTPW